MKLAAKLYSVHEANKKKAEELSQEIKDKIKANNDKMTDLKKNNGPQAEIDALEKENDELNGGNKTFDEADSSDWVSISNEVNKAMLRARKFCKDNKLNNQYKEIDSAYKIFLAVDDSISSKE